MYLPLLLAAPLALFPGEDVGQWSKINEGKTGQRQGSVLIHVPELKQMLLFGLAKDAPFVQAFDPDGNQWTTYSEAEPFKSDFNSPNKQPGFSYQTVDDPGSKSVYCLSFGNVLFVFDVAGKTWKTMPTAK